MKDSINLNSSAQGTPSYLNLISMLMIVVILFQPFYYIILESIDSKQEISMMDKDLNDMEGDDNQEEETEEKTRKTGNRQGGGCSEGGSKGGTRGESRSCRKVRTESGRGN